jgi:hypothetical protein
MYKTDWEGCRIDDALAVQGYVRLAQDYKQQSSSVLLQRWLRRSFRLLTLKRKENEILKEKVRKCIKKDF